ncbi:UdgX family uracil-DNA binding protein [Sinorhizobium meliloti]|uniref:UdgX family uracil-DNA binding protein n=1 Tax=Rhizobium meliloti TaxID=382 RepID=UPI00067EDEE2|nr:UdgX family uracil-DNA binding protein [Sinorhizobium meliloti]
MQNALFGLAPYTVRLAYQTGFAGWRDVARRLAIAGVRPEEVAWEIGGDAGGISPSLREECKGGRHQTVAQPTRPAATLTVSRDFVERAETVFCHSNPERFALLYRMLWRMRLKPALLKIASDPDVRRFEAMEKAVRRDIHKMRAFVRFRKIGEGGDERYVAWFEPEHFIVERNAPFFVRRFTGMRWSILTPFLCAHWESPDLSFTPGANIRDAPAEDAAEELWQIYYENIFNPARLKTQAMKKEMPKKYWRNLPEASLIPRLVAGADAAAREMIEKMPTAPAPHHAKVQAKHWPAPREPAPSDNAAGARSTQALREAAEGCRRCPLWRDATQTVFGEGPDDPAVVFVGEQPGDQEDIAGKPFVGPAGKVFDAVLEEAAIDRRKTYITNAVKHFKFEPRGKRRIHSKPNAGEVQACRWWLDHELALTKPELVVALGATAAQSLLGRAVPITKLRGQVIEREDGLRIFLTIHPSFILRLREATEKEAERERFLDDMRAVNRLMRREKIQNRGGKSRADRGIPSN